jgi:hypothetical protein
VGAEANSKKERACRACEDTFYMTAEALKEHYDMCKRAQRAGLILPVVQRVPRMEIITP